MRLVPKGSVALYKGVHYPTEISLHHPINTPCSRFCFVPSNNDNRAEKITHNNYRADA